MKYLLLVSFLFQFFSCEIPSAQDTKNNLTQTEITAKVIRIIDGDTIEVLLEGKPLKIRLEHIDCPEKRGKQPYGNAAKKVLSDLCFGQIVKLISTNNFDRNGRLITEVINEQGLNINQEMVRLGYAWHFKKYSNNETYAELEKQAQQNKLGLWQDAEPIPPWEWRNTN